MFQGRKNKTIVEAKADIVSVTPHEDIQKVIAKQQEYYYPQKFGKDSPQPDLLYMESVLVSEGFNNNDDVFLHDELWEARFSPSFKPINWQHNDDDIIGVMYGVAAQDLAHNSIDINAEKCDEPFELKVQGAIWQFIFPKKAEEIQRRQAQGNIFVSMEAWYDDFDYVVMRDGNVYDIIKRTEGTKALDTHLRVLGGSGRYKGERIGRGLRRVVFGGKGIVDFPANNRSIISSCESYNPTEEKIGSAISFTYRDSTKNFLAQCATDKTKVNKEVASMSDNTNVDRADVLAEARRVATAETKALLEKNTQEQAYAELSQKYQDAQAEISQLRAQAGGSNNKELYELVDKAFAAALETAVPAEIARIDKAIKSGSGSAQGDAVFQAKLQFLEETLKANAAQASELNESNEKLLAHNQKLVANARKVEVENTLGSYFSHEEVEQFVARAADMGENEYTSWLDTQKVWAAKLAEAAKDKEEKKLSDEEVQKVKITKEKEKAGEHAYEASLPSAAEKYYSAPPDGNIPGGSQTDLGLNSGVSNVPLRHKIAGSQELEQTMDDVKAEAGLNLSGSNSEDAEHYNPMANTVKALMDYRAKAESRRYRGLGRQNSN